MRALGFITAHMVYNPAYNEILQTKETFGLQWGALTLNLNNAYYTYAIL